MKNLREYSGWALVTGASAGIGREFARAIAAQGVPCVLTARRKDRLDELARELRERNGVECQTIQCDLGAPGGAEDLLNAIAGTEIGILVNNAGFGQGGRFENLDVGRLHEMVSLNCLAPALLTRRLLPPMLGRGRGAVIMVSSVLGALPAPYEALYGATKAFDLSFGNALWAEMRGRGVDVVTLCPSTTKTEFLVAEGIAKEKSDRIHARADRPEDVVALTLRRLGRGPTAGPWSFAWPSFLARIMPRSVAARITGAILAKEMLG